MPDGGEIASQLDAVNRRIAGAAQRAGRSPADITLIAVSKTFPQEFVRAAAAAGHRAFGENRVQEGLDKAGRLSDLALEWHLIGHLQSNKARKAAGAFAWIHSIDTVDLMRRVDSAAEELGARPRVLIQVDLAGETTKHGVDERALRDVIQAGLDARAVSLEGLMIVPPIPEDPEASRPWFRQLVGLRDRLVAEGVDAKRLRHLSMGMSQDFEIAIEEGATMVRVGSAIFGSRTPPAAHA